MSQQPRCVIRVVVADIGEWSLFTRAKRPISDRSMAFRCGTVLQVLKTGSMTGIMVDRPCLCTYGKVVVVVVVVG